MRSVALVILSTLTFLCAACKKKSPQAQDTPPQSESKSDQPSESGKRPFLEGTKEVPARLEWNRDFGSRSGGVVTFRVSSTAPFSVTIVTDKGYKALTSGKGKFDKADVLLTVDAKPPTYEGRVTVPPGMSWFIIENQSDAPATMKLECFDGK